MSTPSDHPAETQDAVTLNDVPAPNSANAATIGSDGPLVATAVPQKRTFGDYELIREIARGGMGVVFEARQMSLNRTVALKMILSGHLASAGDVQRFRVEAEAAGHLDHPHIVPIYDIGEQEGQHYFSMKFVDGGSLSHKAGTGKPADMAQIVATVARAVHHAHQRGILHRDLKPANILLDREGQPHVTDFGLAKKVEGDSGLTHSGAIVGTPSYMPPEQARGEKGLTVAADVYSLGAILYECLTGRPPFRASTSLDTLIQVLDTEPAAPRSLNVNIPRDLETICLKCLQKDPKRRYESALAVAEDLERWLRHEPIQARRTSWLGRAGRWCKRNPAVAGLLSALVVAMVSGLIGVTFKWLEAESQRELAVAARDQAETQRQETERHRREAEGNLYVSNLGLAERELQTLNLSQADKLLLDCPGSWRHWEWYYLRRLLREYRARVQDHAKTVAWLAFEPKEGKRLASASYDETVKIWNTDDGTLLRTFDKHTAPVRAVAYSHDGKWIASGGYDRTVKIWDPETLEVRWSLTNLPAFVLTLAFDPTGKYLATAGFENVIRIWDAATGTPVTTLAGHSNHIIGLTFSRDGRFLASGGFDTSLRVWDVEKSAIRHPFLNLGEPVVGVGFSRDGTKVVGGTKSQIYVWDADTGKQVFYEWVQSAEGHTDQLSRLLFSPDGKRVISAGRDHRLIGWNIKPGTQPMPVRFGQHTGQLRCMTLSPDGKLLASGGVSGSERGEIHLSDVATGKFIRSFGNATSDRPGPLVLSAEKTNAGNPARSWTFSADCKRVASLGPNNGIRVWDRATQKDIAVLNGHTKTVGHRAFSPDGKRLASTGADQVVRIWDVKTSTEILQLSEPAVNPLELIFSPDGKLLAVSYSDRILRIWDTTTGQLQGTYKGHVNEVRRATFSADGTHVAAPSTDGRVIVWRLENRERVTQFKSHQAPLHEIAFVPRRGDLRLVTCSSDQTVRIWDGESGKQLSVCAGHVDNVQAIAVSPDGRRIVSGGLDRTVRVWDMDTGRQLLTLRGHKVEVTAVYFSSDGERIVSLDQDGVAMIWDAPGHEGVTSERP